jgi:RNA polymerase sigma-70 factor (ECF subfamily)
MEFERMFIRYRPRFIIIARSYVRDLTVAEDIVTDCFVAFWEKRADLPPDVKPLPYIMTSVKNRCLNHLKEQSRHSKIRNEIYDSRMRIIRSDISALEACNPTELFSDEVASIVKRQLETLPELTRNVLVSIRFMEKSYAETALENDITVRRTEHELLKGLKALRAALHDYMPAILILLNILNTGRLTDL